MAEFNLKATIREYKGRSASNTARRHGRIPGVFYVANEKNIPIEVGTLDLRPLVYTAETHIVNLELSDGTNEKCILREVQFDPVTDHIMHVDFMGLVMSEKMVFEIPVVLEGTAAGVRAGGVLHQLLHKLDVDCLPTDLPEHISIDVSALHSGDTFTVGQITLANGVILNDPEQAVVVIGHARAEEVEAPEAEELSEDEIEPEVIGRGKSDEE